MNWVASDDAIDSFVWVCISGGEGVSFVLISSNRGEHDGGRVKSTKYYNENIK